MYLYIFWMKSQRWWLILLVGLDTAFFLLYVLQYFLLCFSYFQGKAMNAISAFTTGNYSRQPIVIYLFLKSVNLSFMSEFDFDVIKDVNCTKMSHSLAVVKVVIKRTFFSFSSYLFLLMGSQVRSMFLLKLVME